MADKTEAAKTTTKPEGEEKDTRPRAQIRSERAVNSALRSLEILQRFGKNLGDKHKAAVLAAIDGKVTETKNVLAGKAAAKAGFELGD